MIRRMVKHAIARFGKPYRYDTGYLQDQVDADLASVLKLAAARPFLYHRGSLPPEVWRAAQLRATLAADCGPCLALAAAMAQQDDGMDKATVAALLRGEPAGPDMDLAARYADAVISNSPELGELVEAIRTRFGEAGLGALAIAVVSGGFYPLFKRGLGHGMLCAPILKELTSP